MPYYKNTGDNKIVYKDAPSGFINVSKWVPPFMPIKNGFGFVGVLAEDVGTGKLQCHVCGKWFDQLPTHYARKHGINGEQYRERFGLLSGTALKSKRMRLRQSEVMTGLRKTNKNCLRKFERNNNESANRKGKPKAKESQNKYGSCDLQIMTKIIALSHKLGKTPTLVDIKNEYGGTIISIMHKRYGSYVSYCREKLEMEPNFSSFNREFPTDASWKKHLLEIGRQALLAGKPETLRGLLSLSEGRNVYRYFKSFKNYKIQLLKLIKKDGKSKRISNNKGKKRN